MKKLFLFMMLSVVLTFSMTTTSKAETLLGDMFTDVEISASVDYYNKYIWRGFKLDGDPVIQPSVTISAYGFEGGFWGSWDADNDDTTASDEVDVWLGYNFDLGFISEDLSLVGISLGHTWYNFPRGDTGLANGADTKEAYLGISFDTVLAPYVTWYHDYDDESSGGADGNYIMAGIGHSVTLNEDYGVSLDLGYEVGYNDEAFIVGDGGYHLASAGVTIPLTEKATLSTTVAYSSPFGDLEDPADGNQDDELYGGVSLSFAM